MRARTLTGVVLALALVVAAALGGTAAAGGSGSRAPSAGAQAGSSGVLRIGTISYIDSLNPFNYVEAQAYNAMVMIYPQLVQYGPGLKFQGDLAGSWKTSANGKDWTFKLRPNAKWSDGRPLTAADAAWTINTTVKYGSGPTALLATTLAHVKNATAPNPTTLVIHYEAPVGNVLAQLEQFFILPQHVWQKLAGAKGQGLKTYHPELHLPMVTGGAYTISQYEKKGTTAFKPNPSFYGPKSHADGVALTYYTNADAVIADLKAGNIDWADQVPFKAVDAVKKAKNLVVTTIPGAETTNITWNSNPVKPKNRELLRPAVKKALSMCVDRKQIIDVVFAGYASTVESIVGHISSMENPDLGPLRFDCAAANKALDRMGLKRGSDGIRVVPATSGKYAQPAHRMSYEIVTPTSTDFNVDRAFSIVKAGFAKLGVKVTQKVGGDTTATYAIETGDCSGPASKQYTGFDIAMWDWVGYVDPDFMLSVMTRAQWCSWSDTGVNNPVFDKLYDQQGKTVNVAARRAIVYRMQKIVYDNVYYTQLVNEQAIDAHAKSWTGFYPELAAYSKLYYTSPRKG
jgi:peptide/nickel transport system substrate-binding protein